MSNWSGSVVLGFLLLPVTFGLSAAQEVRGRLTGSPSLEPLAGAYVVLLDQEGATVASTLTNQTGWFALTAPTSGTYRVRAEYVGHSTAQEEVSIHEELVAWVELVAVFQAIELDGLTAEVEKACDVPAAAAQRVAVLWDEVRKAFQVTAFVEAEGLYLFEVDRWTRTLDPDRLRVVDEVRRPREGLHPGSPFVSLPPERLAAEGYVQVEPGTDELAYYGPDARVLLARSFQDTHCFGFSPEGPKEGWVGLRFRPRDRRAADIEGTLWIDAATFEPLRLDYRYPVLPWPLITDKVGGQLVFERIPEGPWIVQSWRIRMPVVREESYPFSRGARARYNLTSLIEEGGMVLDAKTGERSSLTVDLGGIEGVVRDSLDGTPVPGARVRLAGTFLEGRSDEDGRFQILDVPEGRYEIVTGTEELDALGTMRWGIELNVAPGALTQVEVRLPSLHAAALASCDQPLTENGRGVILGTALDTAGSALGLATVEVAWETVASPLGQVTRGQDIERRTVLASVPVRLDGSYTVCGAPLDEEITVRAVAPGYRGPPVTVRLAEDDVPRIDLSLVPENLADALVVQVFGADGREPLEAAEVALTNLGRSAVTDASGAAIFPSVPIEPVIIRTRHLAYLPRTDTLEVEGEETTTAQVTLTDRAFDLAPLVVEVPTPEARARRASGSSASVQLAQVDIREAIVNARANNVAEVLRDAMPNGLRLSPMVSGSNYVGTCIESTRGNLQYRKRPGFCDMVQVVVDGGYLSTLEAARLVENFPLSEIVSMEFLSPMEETFRYGTAQGRGMLIIRTARLPR